MTYTSGSTIVDDDYNIFATGNGAGTGDNNVANINTVWGAGTGDKGYGQSSTISPVAAGQTVLANSWATLITRMTTVANHQGTSITPITNPATGDTITAYSALSSNITSLYNNRLNCNAQGTDSTTTTVTTSSWNTSAVTTKTLTFSSANALRYFFNAGGEVRMSFSRTGGTASDQNTAWTDLLTAGGTIVVTGSGASKTHAGTTYTGTTKIGGTGTPTTLLTGTGVTEYTPTTTYEIFRQYSDAYIYVYTALNYKIQASVNSGATVLSLVVTLDDAVTKAPDSVDGTLTMTTTVRPPSTTYLTNTWGTPTQNTATWTLT